MTRFPHDQFAKDYLEELLKPLGEVQAPRRVAGEVREIDVFFAPKPQPMLEPSVLGLLGRLASRPCLLEPFRNAPTPSQIRSCLSKLFDVYAELERQAKREKTSVQEANLPWLWILSPTASVPLLDGFKATLDEDDWLRGVYFLGDSFKTALVAIHHLPRTYETLWLRILGKGTVQKQAIIELAALPEGNPLRASALESLASLRLSLVPSEDLDEEDRELFMNLSPAYLQWREETLQEGMHSGIRLMVESMLEVKFGAIDEELSQIVEPLMQLEARDRTQLLMQLSREELLARFGKPTP